MSAQQPALTVVPGGLTPAALRTARDELWEAWRRLPDFEDRAGDLGAGLAPDLIVLWAVWRFGGTDPGEPLLRELVDDQYRLRFHDPLVEDMILVAFALGAGWGVATVAPGDSGHTDPQPPAPAVS